MSNKKSIIYPQIDEKYAETRDKLVEYFKLGEKRSGHGKIGIELEHLVVNALSGESATYFGGGGVEELLQGIAP
ncbi:MAG: hypothetical protein LBS99_01215, partial [Clostridiales bacterium]|nr:hypothetical protein [Clostridiales bacterium]